ncbi:hypothetical protein [Frankia sp. EAN1pec]|uniref:hypothetical protein n=1 Tax=Parafrankia sp. (strain EAN1pec) TaxID=298653 RepID=UPI0003088CB6
MSGILTRRRAGWFCKPNLGCGRFGPVRPVAPVPSMVGAAGARTQLLDLAEDGQVDVVTLDGPTS